MKENEFVFDNDSSIYFCFIKEKLVISHVIIAHYWDLPFDLMCDASDYVVEAVLGQQNSIFVYVLYYASKVRNENQINYSATYYKMSAKIFSLENFCS